jgi:hypothetical protein
MTHKKVKKFYVSTCWKFSLRADGFSCGLDALRGLGIKNCNFFNKVGFCFYNFTIFVLFFWRATVSRSLLRLCRPFLIFE